jgi:hypothetical protein
MMPFFERKDDWKSLLEKKDEKKLNEILIKTEKHKAAYRKAGNVKIAQLWSTILEMEKEKEIIEKRLRRIEYIFSGMTERLKDEVRLEEARKSGSAKEIELQNLIRSLEKF